MIKKIISKILLSAMLLLPFTVALPAGAVTPAAWDVTGSYLVNVNYQSVDYPETLILAQNESDITGTSLDTVPPGSLFSVTSGLVSENNITFDASQGSLVTHFTGTIANDGSMSGTWADEEPGTRTGTWASTSGNAVMLGSLAAEDFGVVSYDTGLGMLKGYTAGFGVTDATFAGATSVVVQLFAGSTVLQTNTAILPKFNADITGTQFSSPFDVSGTFDYATDGYWTNVRASEYGQSVPATKVVATVTLSNGKVVTAENSTLTGDPSTIFPEVNTSITTNAATNITSTDATLNGTNGSSAAIGHSFWASLSPFSTASPSLPVNVYSTPNLGALAANASFSASLSSVSGLPAITANTTYYFVAWSNVGGTWYPDSMLNFTTGSGDGTTGTIGGTVGGNGVLKVDSIETTDGLADADGTFTNGWKYTFNVTLPTNEPNIAMKFGDWTQISGVGVLAAANNIRISSAEADNGGATVLITAANLYSSPTLHMVTDLDPDTDGVQVKILVEVAVPTGSVHGSYTTSYGVKTN